MGWARCTLTALLSPGSSAPLPCLSSAFSQLLAARGASGRGRTSSTWVSKLKKVAAAKKEPGWRFSWCKMLHFGRAQGCCTKLPHCVTVRCHQEKPQVMHLNAVNGAAYNSSSGVEEARFSLVPDKWVWFNLVLMWCGAGVKGNVGVRSCENWEIQIQRLTDKGFYFQNAAVVTVQNHFIRKCSVATAALTSFWTLSRTTVLELILDSKPQVLYLQTEVFWCVTSCF